jgi:predicted metal-dependent phosphoesterase TrpH
VVFANLHLHTYFSDGMMSPSDLAKRVFAENGLNIFAITDHDTLSGIEPVFRFIREYSKSTAVNEKRFVPGIELSLEDKRTGMFVHLIGLFPGVNTENYAEALKTIDAVIGDYCRYRCKGSRCQGKARI